MQFWLRETKILYFSSKNIFHIHSLVAFPYLWRSWAKVLGQGSCMASLLFPLLYSFPTTPPNPGQNEHKTPCFSLVDFRRKKTPAVPHGSNGCPRVSKGPSPHRLTQYGFWPLGDWFSADIPCLLVDSNNLTPDECLSTRGGTDPYLQTSQ